MRPAIECARDAAKRPTRGGSSRVAADRAHRATRRRRRRDPTDAATREPRRHRPVKHLAKARKITPQPAHHLHLNIYATQHNPVSL